MTNQEVKTLVRKENFKMAHKIAKDTVKDFNNYRDAFASALKYVLSEIKKAAAVICLESSKLYAKINQVKCAAGYTDERAHKMENVWIESKVISNQITKMGYVFGGNYFMLQVVKGNYKIRTILSSEQFFTLSEFAA